MSARVPRETQDRPLRPWQGLEVAEHALKPKRAILADPRTGKTLASRVSFETARVPLALDSLLVSCPLSVGPMWVSELKHVAGLNVIPLYKDELVERAFQLGILNGQPDPGAYALVMNEDVVATLKTQLLRLGLRAVIVDESHHMRGVSSNRGRALRELCWAAQWVRLLTGTPAPKHYGNLWGQMVALDRDLWGSSYHNHFKARYLKMNEQFPGIVDETINEDELQAKLLSCASFARREDVFGPDKFEFQVEWLDLPPPAASAYRRLAKEFVLDNPDIDARHILTRLTRLQQLASGYLPVKDWDDSIKMETMHTVKLDAVLHSLGNVVDVDMKAVLFHRFKWEGQQYEKLCKERFGKDVPIYTIKAKTDTDVRDRDCHAFNAAKGAAIIIAQTRTGGISIDLSEADYVFRASQSFEADYESQAVLRAFKPGVPRIVVDFRMNNTVDPFIAETLRIGHAMDRAVMHADRESMVYGRIKRPKQKVA